MITPTMNDYKPQICKPEEGLVRSERKTLVARRQVIPRDAGAEVSIKFLEPEKNV